MCEAHEFTKLELDFDKKFGGGVWLTMDYPGQIYSNKKGDFRCDMGEEEIDQLMEQSLKEGKDLLYEKCKDKPISEEEFYHK